MSLPAPMEIEASMSAERAEEAREAAKAAKQPPLVFMLSVTNAAVLMPLHSTCASQAGSLSNLVGSSLLSTHIASLNLTPVSSKCPNHISVHI